LHPAGRDPAFGVRAWGINAKAHGAIAVQTQGNDPTRLVQEYIERVRHTVRFMASDTVARAQEIIWKNSNGNRILAGSCRKSARNLGNR
jgi:hypothetical protein